MLWTVLVSSLSVGEGHPPPLIPGLPTKVSRWCFWPSFGGEQEIVSLNIGLKRIISDYNQGHIIRELRTRGRAIEWPDFC